MAPPSRRPGHSRKAQYGLFTGYVIAGIGALIAVNDGRASVAAGVTDDLVGQVSAVDLVKAAVAALGGQGGGGGGVFDFRK